MQKINDYSIGVVSYLGRYEAYFKPLITQLAKIFPDKDIVCVLNGHYDKLKELDYLRSVTQFLTQFKNVRYVTFEDNQSLSKCWNWLAILSKRERVLIMNDDLSVSGIFRHSFESAIVKHPDFFTINHSWSHFLISGKIIKKIGWFDERFVGVGMEDGDYACRMAEAGIPIVNSDLVGIKNIVAKTNNPGWANVSEAAGKYTKANTEMYNNKWLSATHKSDDSFFKVYDNMFVKLIKGMNTPLFYSFEVLNKKSERLTIVRQSRSYDALAILLLLVKKIRRFFGKFKIVRIIYYKIYKSRN